MALQDSELATFDLLGDGQVEYSGGSYLDSLAPEDILDDPRFIQDLKQWYYKQGKRFNSNEDMIREWYDDRTFAELNMTVGTGQDILENNNLNAEDRALKKRLVQAYQQSPFFWQEGGMGERDGWQVFKSIGKAIATDPLNAIGPLRAAPAAAKAAASAAASRASQRAAGRAVTGPTPTMAGVKAGAYTGGVTEAAVAAPIAAAGDALIQARDEQLGLQDGYNPTQGAIATVAGGALGGIVGTATGAGTGLMGGRTMARGIQEGQMAEILGARNELINGEPGEFAMPEGMLSGDLDADADAILREAKLTDAIGNAYNEIDAQNAQAANQQARAPTESEERTGMQISDIDMEQINDRVSEAHADLEAARADPETPEDELVEYQRRFRQATELQGLAGRIQAEENEIQALLNSNKDHLIQQGITRRDALLQVANRYRQLMEDTDPNPNDIWMAGRELGGNQRDPDMPPSPEDIDVNSPERASSSEQAATPDANTPEQPADAGAPEQAPEQAADGGPFKPLTEINIDRTYEVDGEMVADTMTAQARYEELTGKMDALHKLRACLNGA